MKKENTPKVPTEAEFNKLTSKQQEARKRAASLNNVTLSPEEKAAKEAMENKKTGGTKNMGGMKNMNMGGMTAPMMPPKKMPPKRKPAPRPSPIVDPMAKSPDPRMKDPRAKRGAMPMMKEGGDMPKYKAGKKVRGYGKARGGKACKMR